MATLRETLGNNPYAGYIIPVIEYFNNPNNRPFNPVSAVAVASILTNRSLNWNGGPEPPVQGIGKDICCCPENTQSGSNCSWCARNPATTGSCCKPCSDNGSSTAKASPAEPVETLLINLAAEVQLGNPWVPVVRKFEREIYALDASQPNSWIFFQQIIEIFYANVTFLSYFASGYLNGIFGDVVNSICGGTFQNGVNTSGLIVTTLADGSSSPATPGSTKVTFNSTDPGDENSYYIIYTDATNATVFWYNFGLFPVPPVVVIAGVSITYVMYLIDPALTPADFATEIQNQSVGLIGFDSILQVDVSAVEYITTANGERATSDFAAMPVTWDGLFVDGADGGQSKEISQIDFSQAVSRNLNGQWFKLYNLLDSHLFYYSLDGATPQPAEPADFYHEIIIPSEKVFGANTSGIVQRATEAAIIGTGFWVFAKEPCSCSCKDPGCTAGNQCDDPCLTQVSTVASGNSTNADGGTAQIGDTYADVEVVAPDGKSFGFYPDINAFAYVWNHEVVPYMAIRGGTYYLKPVLVKMATCCICCPNDNCCYSATFLQRPSYLAVTADIPFNISNSQFVATSETRAPGALM